MSIPIYLDVETVPGQDEKIFKNILDETHENFKVSSTVTKTELAKDLKITDPNEFKNTSRNDMTEEWLYHFKDKKVLDLAKQKWRATSLSGGTGELISWAFSDGFEMQSEYRELKGETTEFALVGRLFQSIRHVCQSKDQRIVQPYFIGHHIRFDLQFLFQRAAIFGIDPGFKLPFDGNHGKDFYCTQQAWCGRGNRISQNKLCEILGLPPKPNDIDGSKVWDHVLAGNEKRVGEYNQSDIEAVIAMYNQLIKVGGHYGARH